MLSDQAARMSSSSSSTSSGSTVSFIPSSLIKLHDGYMELAKAHAFVNFANQNFGYGKFILSCTQEEIMQICCPEFNVAMLHHGLMQNDSVVLTHNVRRFAAYTGFLNSFRFAGNVNADVHANAQTRYPPQSIITMDAVFERHFEPTSVERA